MGEKSILDELASLADHRSADGSYNRLVKQAHTYGDEDLSYILNAFREYANIELKDPEGYNCVRDENGFLFADNIDEILSRAYVNGASDIHIAVGAPPKMRLHGELLQMPYRFLAPVDTRNLLSVLLTEDTIKDFDKEGDIDFAYSIPGMCRFRVNMFKQRGTWGAVFRTLSNSIPTADSLKVPQAVQALTSKKRGLILVTGPTGSGKSTTLASLIRIINETRHENIITLEDPIEYLHRHNKSTVIQREMGSDSKSFAASIRAALREDPDVILIGEMRDPETIATAITAAETGHLVFSTLHTIGAAATVDRIIDSFPENQQAQVRTQLVTVLEAVISQQLIPLADGTGRCAAFEVMLSNSAVRNLIKENKIQQINSTIQTNKAMGMVTMDDSIRQLYLAGYIDRDKAIEFAVDKNSMENMI